MSRLPRKLSPERRDSVCAQYHLSGVVRVDRAGSFQPDGLLADYLSSKAVARSSAVIVCGAAPATIRIRSRRTVRRRAISADHSIPRRAGASTRQATSSIGVLKLFGGGAASDRDLGMAYALVVESERNPEYESRAFALLKTAVAARPDDTAAMVQLALLYSYHSEEDQAIALYEKAVRADPAAGGGGQQSGEVSGKARTGGRGDTAMVQRVAAESWIRSRPDESCRGAVSLRRYEGSAGDSYQSARVEPWEYRSTQAPQRSSIVRKRSAATS